MNEAFCNVISEGDEARRDLFVTTAGRMGTAVQYVEKDFWVCWTLDALFHGLRAGAPRLLFKGGTSLSKSFGLINRFSEDIDITVFRGDLGQAATVEDLEALSGKKRKAKLDAIKTACQVEPFRIKSLEAIRCTKREESQKLMKAGGYNLAASDSD